MLGILAAVYFIGLFSTLAYVIFWNVSRVSWARMSLGYAVAFVLFWFIWLAIEIYYGVIYNLKLRIRR